MFSTLLQICGNHGPCLLPGSLALCVAYDSGTLLFFRIELLSTHGTCYKNANLFSSVISSWEFKEIGFWEVADEFGIVCKFS